MSTPARGKGNGFISAIIAVCTSPDSVPAYMRQPLWMALMRYLALSLSCLLVFTILRAIPLRKQSSDACQRFQQKFGNIVTTETEIRPANDSGDPIQLRLGVFYIDYFPGIESAKNFSPEKKSLGGILWLPENMIIWRRIKPEEFSVFQFPRYLFIPDAGAIRKLPRKTDKDGILKHLSAQAAEPDESSRLTSYLAENWQSMLQRSGAKPEPDQIKVSALADIIWLTIIFGLVGSASLFYAVMTPAYIILCCSVMHIFRNPRSPRLQLTQLVKMGVYSAFPALIIASLYSGLKLPVFDFQIVFSLAFLIYLFIVYGRIRVNMGKPARENIQ